MGIEIRTHEVDLEGIKFELEFRLRVLPEALASAKKYAASLPEVASEAENCACLVSRMTPVGSELCRYLRLAAQASSAIFGLASITSVSLEFLLDDEQIVLQGTGPNSSSYASNWIKSFYLAATCRDVTALNRLSRTPLSVLRASSTKNDEYAYAHVAALQAYWQGQPTTPNLLLDALHLANPENASITPRDVLLFLVMSEMELLYNVLLGDSEGFNAALIKALEYHRRYWTSDEELMERSQGLLAISPVAIASLAYEQGLEVTEIDSEYFPMYLVRGGCVD